MLVAGYNKAGEDAQRMLRSADDECAMPITP